MTLFSNFKNLSLSTKLNLIVSLSLIIIILAGNAVSRFRIRNMLPLLGQREQDAFEAKLHGTLQQQAQTTQLLAITLATSAPLSQDDLFQFQLDLTRQQPSMFDLVTFVEAQESMDRLPFSLEDVVLDDTVVVQGTGVWMVTAVTLPQTPYQLITAKQIDEEQLQEWQTTPTRLTITDGQTQLLGSPMPNTPPNNTSTLVNSEGTTYTVHTTPLNDTLSVQLFLSSNGFPNSPQNSPPRILFILLATMIALLLLFTLLLRSTLIRPLQNLQVATDLIGRGTWQVRLPTEQQDEIGLLAQSIQEMAIQLQGAFGGLETRVQERTQALQEAKDEAEQANRAKSIFLANMSHELRTPLAAVLGYSEMLQEQAEANGREKEVIRLEKIIVSAKHLQMLISDILDLSKIEAGRAELELFGFDVASFMDEVLISVRPLIAKNQNQLETHISPHIGPMHNDANKLRQIMHNLLSNAAKFTQNGTIQLTIDSTPEQMIVFQVEDTGIGLSSEQIEKIFEPFVQAEVSIGREYGGTGLGLAISQQFCQLMGGKIEVTSQEGVGSTFTVTLPREISPTN